MNLDAAGDIEEGLSLVSAARRLGVSKHVLRTWAVYQHRVAFHRLGRRLIFTPADLDDFMRRHRVEAE
jgi:hypothetical protein